MLLNNLNRYVQYTFLFLSISLLSSCATTSGPQPIQTVSYPYYEVEEPSVQEQGGLTVEVEPILSSVKYVKKHPELFAFDLNEMPKDWHFYVPLAFPADAQGRHWAYTFGWGDYYLITYRVKITNSTDHILRMKDARIYLRIEGQDPVKAVTNLGNTNLVPDKTGTLYPASYLADDDSLVDWVTQFEHSWEKSRPKSFLTLSHKVGIPSQVIRANKRNYKLINDVDLEILPGDSYSGILLFPRLVKYDEATLKFYDMTTKTDKAGNPTEKATFDFEFKKNVGKVWYDRVNKTWVDGDPPQSVPGSV